MPRLLRPALAATAFLFPALSGCATISGQLGDRWTTALVGAQEVPGPGDPDGTGTAIVTADSATDTVCVELTVRGIATPTAAHIHRGRMGESGPPVLTLTPPIRGTSKECLDVDKALAAAILAEPAGYYVNVHNAEHPAGAVRGQLAGR